MMGATVESCTFSAEWQNRDLAELTAYKMLTFVDSYLRFILQTYPGKKIFIVNYGMPAVYFHEAIHNVDGIWGVINIGFPTFSYIDGVKHIRGVSLS